MWKNTTDQGEDHTVACLFDYQYFKENYKLVTIYLSQQQAIQKIDFTGNFDEKGNTTMCFITEFAKNNLKSIAISYHNLKVFLI